MAEIEGEYPVIDRFLTGIYSLDEALGDPRKGVMGVPLHTCYEIYGHSHVGKSTFAYFLAGVVSGENKICCCDLEGLDRDYLLTALEYSGFSGKVKLVDAHEKKTDKFRTHESMMNELVDDVLYDDEYSAGILDSVGAIMPVMERDGDFGEAFMGRRAKLVAQFSRRSATIVQKRTPAIMLVVNHLVSILSGTGGYQSAGGETLKFLSGTRIHIKAKETITSGEDKLPILYVMSGKVDKLRYGGKGRSFQLVNIPGYGINKDMSAVFDCINKEYAKREATIKVDGKSVGRLTKLIDEAIDGNTDKFAVFYDKLRSGQDSRPEIREGDDEIPEYNESMDSA